MFPLEIKSVSDEKDLYRLREFLLKQSQFYPDYTEWVDGKCTQRIESGIYKTIIALSSGSIIGDCIYSVGNGDSSVADFIEIKNFRIDPGYRNRDLGHFLLRQVETESMAGSVKLDVTVDNFPAVQFFIRNGFNILGKECLYASGQYEYLMSKSVPQHLASWQSLNR